MKSAWMGTAAGILSIVAGAFRLLIDFGPIITIAVTGGAVDYVGDWYWTTVDIRGLLWTITALLLVSAALALVGGVYALQRRKWGLALAGSIAAFFPFDLTGLAAVVLTALSKDEFGQETDEGTPV